MSYVELVFMPMRINLDELPGFVELAARVKVDRIVLRPLNYSTVSTLNWDREGSRFEYLKELLPFDELVRASGRAGRPRPSSSAGCSRFTRPTSAASSGSDGRPSTCRSASEPTT